MRRAIVVLVLLPALAGCLASEPAEQAAPPEPDPGTQDPGLPETITGLEHVTGVPDVASGAGVFVHGDHAYVSGLGNGLYVVDLSNGTDPEVVGHLDDLYARDADILEYAGHHHAAILAGQGDGLHVVNVSDPADPVHITSFHPDGDVSHNAAVLPGTPLVYNSPGSGRGGENQIVDLSDPTDPRLVATFGRSGCHDITFHRTADKDRLVCAGEASTELYDLSDPLEPEYISEVRNPFISVVGFVGGDGGSLTPGLHHWSFLSPDGETLVIGDEFAGGRGPGCYAHVQQGDQSRSTPLGALWFYDVSDEEDPELLGWFSPPAPVQGHAETESTSCTAHFGTLLDDRPLVAIGWYQAGVILVDFADPANPVMVDQWNPATNVWDVRYHDGRLITGDTIRGADLLDLTG